MIIETTSEFMRWFNGLKDKKVVSRVVVRLQRVEQDGYFGDSKSVGGGVSEMRIDYGSGYRLYYTIRGEEAVFLLCGGDKSSQQKDIKKAKLMAAEIK